MPSAFQLRRACHILDRGGIVAYPTESVFGLGCDPANRLAVMSLLALKQRDWRKGLIVVAATIEQLDGWINWGDKASYRRMLESRWPGPETWVLPALPHIPRWLRGQHDTLAVRVTDHPGAAALAEAWGGCIVSTSANRSSARPARSALALRRSLGRACPFILPGRVGGLAQPTPIRDIRSGLRLR